MHTQKILTSPPVLYSLGENFSSIAYLTEDISQYSFTVRVKEGTFIEVQLTQAQFMSLRELSMGDAEVINLNYTPPTEIEHRYFINSLPDISQIEGEHIRQQWLAVDGNNASIRVRESIKGNTRTYTLALKAGKGVSRVEKELELSQAQFDILWAGGVHNWVLEKTRYTLDLPGTRELKAEIDIFSGKLSGHLQVEIEFPDVASAERFEMQKMRQELTPSESSVVSFPEKPQSGSLGWIGANITQRSEYVNLVLAQRGLPQKEKISSPLFPSP